MSPLRILSLATCYPNPSNPITGKFIRARLLALAETAEVHVMAPLPALNYARLGSARAVRKNIPKEEQDGPLKVWHPRWFYPPMGGALNTMFLGAQLIRPVQRVRATFPFQLIDAHFGHPEGVAAALLSIRFRVPFIVTLRGSEVDHAASSARRKAMGWSLRRAARVIAVSERLRQFALSLGVDERCSVVIPNGVDSEIFHPSDRQACRRACSIPEGRLLIFTAGNLVELKGHDRTIDAAKALVAEGLPVQLAIAGSGPEEGPLRRQIEELSLSGQVHLLGALPPDRLAEWMCAADVFCLSSRREGWPNAVQEAMACGAPVVAANVGAIPAMLVSADYGLIVPPNDAAALAGALRQALNTRWDRDAIARWGMSRSWPQVAAEVLRQFEQVLAAPNG